MTVADDADRERVIAILREQAGEGRLDLDEFGQRLDEAYQADSLEQLQHALRELPVPPLAAPPRPSAAPAPVPPRGPDAIRPRPGAPRPVPHRGHVHPLPPEKAAAMARAAWGAHLGAYLSVNAMLIVIWLLTSPGGYFWPMWPMMGWGIGLASHGMAHAAGTRHRAKRLER
jgi:hypothetical protein